MADTHWKTAITKIEPNKISLRGYRIDELMGNISYSQGVYLAIKGELPSEQIGKLMDVILVSSIDHGVTPPSVLSAMTVASTGASLNASIAAGILAINKFHGGAIEGCMNALLEGIEIKNGQNCTDEEAARELLAKLKARKQRMPGFGHRIHTADPRTAKLFSIAEESGVSGQYVAFAKSIEITLEQQLGRKLPINVDGAIAALLCEMEFSPNLANAFFIMARIPGLVAHIHEEQTRQKPMRRIHPTDYEYDGVEEREL